ncbi:retrovirus-related pol polyprotein from transposon TNT 1-94 [Tanacetum coccineum]
MDLCEPMRIQSINGRRNILVIVDDYSRFTWVKFLRSKDEVPEFVIKFLKMIQVRLNATVQNIRVDNGTEFVNQTLRAYYEDVGISHQTSVACTPKQNGVVERRNQTLVEASRTMKPDLSYLHVFGALCYPTNDSEDLGLVQNPPSPTPYVPPTKKDWDILFQPMFDEYFNPPPSVASPVLTVVAPEPTDSTGTPSLTSIDQDAPSPNNDPFFGVPIPKPNSKESSSMDVIPTNMDSINQPPEHLRK